MLTFFGPQKDLNRMSRDIDELFGRMGHRAPSAFQPAVDVEENDEGFVLRADLPGVSQEAIDIQVDGRELVISGTRETLGDDKQSGSRIRERRFGKFVRRFSFGGSIKSDAIEASYKEGVLTVKLPKREEVKPRHIPVNLH